MARSNSTSATASEPCNRYYDYIALPAAGLYQPIWEYDAKTLAWDLSDHLAYGAGTGTTFWLLTRIA